MLTRLLYEILQTGIVFKPKIKRHIGQNAQNWNFKLFLNNIDARIK